MLLCLKLLIVVFFIIKIQHIAYVLFTVCDYVVPLQKFAICQT